jgi:hypothetical protein
VSGCAAGASHVTGPDYCIVYWSKDRLGQRDIYTIPSAGGAALPLTADAAFDWSPV